MGNERIYVESLETMSKTIQSDIKGFKGSFVLREPLYLDDVFAIENALDESAEIEPSAFWKRINEMSGSSEAGVTWSSRTDAIFLKAILRCVERFEIENLPATLTAETFPMTPRATSSALIKLLWDELQNIYNGETSIPNES